MTGISQQQLESYLWGAATLLRGTIDAGDYKQFIFPPHRSQSREFASWVAPSYDHEPSGYE